MTRSAGTQDSALTTHGSLQAERLGQHFAHAGFRLTHIFSSDLQRASKTANAIRLAQDSQKDGSDNLDILTLTVLREQDFGSMEGKSFSARKRGSEISSVVHHRSQYNTDSNFMNVESKESMNRRMNGFIQDHLLPLLCHETSVLEPAVCIISHGIILSHLWRCFLKVFPRKSVILAPSTERGTSSPVVLEHLGGWSNTGYLELDVHKSGAEAEASMSDFKGNLLPHEQQPTTTDQSLPPILPHLKMIIKTINGRDHLKSLKRTRGGVGSSKHDEGQKKIESFFKKRNIG